MTELWDSGKVDSDQSVNVEYAGKPLSSGTPCEWKVRVWDQDGKPSAWSAPAKWTMGILRPEDWTAQRISTEITPPASTQGERLKLLKATYVALDGTASVDVTEHVAKLVKNGRLNLKVEPKLLGGDPALNHVKELRVVYEVKGERREAAAEDFQNLNLPELRTPWPGPLDEPYVRRTFVLEDLPESAMATVNVMGFYECEHSIYSPPYFVALGRASKVGLTSGNGVSHRSIRFIFPCPPGGFPGICSRGPDLPHRWRIAPEGGPIQSVLPPLACWLAGAGVRVMPHVCGDVETVLRAFLADTMDRPELRMPGCSQGRCGWQHHRHRHAIHSRRERQQQRNTTK